MGQQVYERELIGRAQDELGPDWRVDPIEVRTLRSSRAGTVRIPSGLLGDAPPLLRRAAGRYVYPRSTVVHRLDLRLPPAPHPEVLTIHDAAPWRFPDEGSVPADAATTARNAATVVCPSQFAADEISGQFDVVDPVAIHNGVNRRFFDASPLPEGNSRTSASGSRSSCMPVDAPGGRTLPAWPRPGRWSARVARRPPWY